MSEATFAQGESITVILNRLTIYVQCILDVYEIKDKLQFQCTDFPQSGYKLARVLQPAGRLCLWSVLGIKDKDVSKQ